MASLSETARQNTTSAFLMLFFFGVPPVLRSSPFAVLLAHVRDNHRVGLYLFTAQHIIRIPHYRPLQGAWAFSPSSPAGAPPPAPMAGCLASHRPYPGPLTPYHCNEKPPGIYIGSELFTRREVLDLLHDHFPGAEFGKVLIKPYKHGLAIYPEDRDQFKTWGLKFLSSEVCQGRLKLSAVLYNPRVDRLISAHYMPKRTYIIVAKKFLSHSGDLYSDFTRYEVYPRRGDGDPLGGASHYVRVSFVLSSWRDLHKFLGCTMEYGTTEDDAEAVCPTLWLDPDFFELKLSSPFSAETLDKFERMLSVLIQQQWRTMWILRLITLHLDAS